MANSPMQIIYLNGPSSSGKTTLAKALQHAFDELFLHVGIDKIIGWMPEKVNDWTGGEAVLGYSWKKGEDASGNPIQELQVGPFAEKIAKTFQEVVFTLAKSGHYLIIDDVSFGKKQIDEWKEILKGFNVLWVGVNAPLSILEQREKERGNRIVGSARGQFHKVHVDAIYDLRIDTHHATVAENTEKIKRLVLHGNNDEMVRKNQQKFSSVKQLNLPIDQYAITGSGALGIRNLREIGDVDIIVTAELWNTLAEKYGVTDENNIKKVVLPGGIVEVLGEGSFYTQEKDKNEPSIADRIAHAEIIEQLPFESLEHVLYYKRKMGRDKDLNDILLIEKPCLFMEGS